MLDPCLVQSLIVNDWQGTLHKLQGDICLDGDFQIISKFQNCLGGQKKPLSAALLIPFCLRHAQTQLRHAGYQIWQG